MMRHVWFVVGDVLLLAGRATAEPEKRQDLRAAVADLARSVKAVVEKAEQASVRIGRFTPSGLDDANAGDGISALLAEVLGGFVNPNGVLEVQGLYGFVGDGTGSGVKVVKIKAKVVNTQTLEELKAFLPLDAIVKANGDIAKMINPTGRIVPNGSYEERNKELQKKPSVFIDPRQPSLISTSKDSPFVLEVRAKALKDHEKHEAQPREAKVNENGQAFVGIDKGDLYELRLLNRGAQEAAVAVAIDGIDQFTFSEDRAKDGRPRFTHWILSPAKDGKPGELLILGWHKTADPKRKDNVLSFLVTDNGKGAAARFAQQAQGKVGVITVSFACSFPEGTTRSTGAETGFGPPREVKQHVVKRVIDPPHEFISVRYLR